MKRIARFEKVSFEQFLSGFDGEFSLEEIKEMYENLQLPRRATKGSAGYDFLHHLILH
jgi:dUTP pyrophosphatase